MGTTARTACRGAITDAREALNQVAGHVGATRLAIALNGDLRAAALAGYDHAVWVAHCAEPHGGPALILLNSARDWMSTCHLLTITGNLDAARWAADEVAVLAARAAVKLTQGRAA